MLKIAEVMFKISEVMRKVQMLCGGYVFFKVYFVQSVFIQSVFLRNVPDLRVL